MHGERNIKFVNAEQARPIYHYRNIKEKLHKTNSSIWFNKICKSEQLVYSLVKELKRKYTL
jgi:hypothetical protein